jgi:hypothetical protein
MDEINVEALTPEETEILKSMGVVGSYPQEEEKQNIFTFFRKVISMEDNSRTANLTKDEIGEPRIPVRTCKQLSLFCNALGSKGLAWYFNENAQIVLGTSLSREGFLDRLAVTQKREVEAKRRNLTQNKSWFKPKGQEPVQ